MEKLYQKLKGNYIMKKNEDISIEDAFKKLDKIVIDIEKDNIPLDKMIKLFEEGAIITEHCRSKITDAEKKIKKIIKKYDK